jgi:hypothetical protein
MNEAPAVLKKKKKGPSLHQSTEGKTVEAPVGQRLQPCVDTSSLSVARGSPRCALGGNGPARGVPRPIDGSAYDYYKCALVNIYP